MSISNGWFAVSVYRCLERGIPPLLSGTSGVVRARLQESFSSASLLENPTRAQEKKEICTNPPHWSANKLANTCNRSALQAGLPAIYCRLFSKPFDTGFILHRRGLWACETTKCHLVRLLRFLPQIRCGLCCYKARTSLIVRLWSS